MAVSCHVAFGHYLRTLRERRGLALEDVWTLSQTFPESLNKGYLSRCENGKQKLAFPKVVAISRIYEVPADVLVERLELDLELEKIGGPSTEKLSWAQLREAGKNAMSHGHRWAAYTFLRDATLKANKADLDASSFGSLKEQIVVSFMNVASVAQTLGKNRYALAEFRFAENCGRLGPNSKILAAERLAAVHRSLGNTDLSDQYADVALERLNGVPNSSFEPDVYFLHGIARMKRKELTEAIPWFQKAYNAFRDRGMIKSGAHALIALADCYHDIGNLNAATRTLQVVRTVSDKHSLLRIKALTLTIQGLVDQDSEKPASAEKNLREADKIARELNDGILRFQVEFYLYKHALAQNQIASARAIRRRLDKLSLSVPSTVEQMMEFRELVRENR
ncbi:MAG: hypothetical protein E2P01_08555 [Acidobacteria bacterium]|nr:MAG: hypothetical protein E2P01_08555 [Acidobacteriota bacterium]